MLRTQIGAIVLGTIFVFVGSVACAIAAIRGHSGVRILLWFGLLNLMWGARLFAYAPVAFSGTPQGLQSSLPAIIAILSYVTVIPGLLFFLELSRGILRRLLKILLIAELPVCAAGIGAVLFTKSPYRFIHYSNVLAILFIVLVAFVVSVPRLAERFGVQRHPVSTSGFLVVGVTALYANFRGFLNLPEYRILEPIAFAVLMFSLGYVAADKIFRDRRRLITIENELAVAREIQTSILPTGIPEIRTLRISAAYHPMTAVAGDFYEFIPVDQYRVGFLVADVSGHGVPAALIASMLKVAMQSLAHCAHQPSEVLSGLNRILCGQLRSHLVSAAYLWIDTESGEALYSAAGHPPLLRWRQGVLERIESNGLLIGVLPDACYPVCEISLEGEDRFLLYTDGLVEPENVTGDSFGDRRLEVILRRDALQVPAALSASLLAELNRWQPASTMQEDDITLIIIDIAAQPSSSSADEIAGAS